MPRTRASQYVRLLPPHRSHGQPPSAKMCDTSLAYKVSMIRQIKANRDDGRRWAAFKLLYRRIVFSNINIILIIDIISDSVLFITFCWHGRWRITWRNVYNQSIYHRYQTAIIMVKMSSIFGRRAFSLMASYIPKLCIDENIELCFEIDWLYNVWAGRRAIISSLFWNEATASHLNLIFRFIITVNDILMNNFYCQHRFNASISSESPWYEVENN